MEKLIYLLVISIASLHMFKKTDPINYSFINQKHVKGTWKSVDFISDIKKFNPKSKNWSHKFSVKEIEFRENGNIKCNYSKINEENYKWTKGKIINLKDSLNNNYITKKINGQWFMFLEWKTDRYIFLRLNPFYYVLKKEN